MRRKAGLATPLNVGLSSLLCLSLSLSGCNSKPKVADAPCNRSSNAKTKDRGAEIIWELVPQILNATFSRDSAWLITKKEGDLLYTNDGGANWNNISTNVYDGACPVKFSQISFLDSQRGWAVNDDGQVWRTIDGGRSWAITGSLESAESKRSEFGSALQIYFNDELNGWLIETFKVWRTSDGGSSWTEVFSISDQRVKGQPVRGVFLDPLNAWICGTEGELYHTTDGGKNWRVQTIGVLAFSDIFFVDEKNGWLSCSVDGQVYSTNDGGKNWRPQPRADVNTSIKSTWFLNKQEGWAVGRRLLDGSATNTTNDLKYSRGVVLHTTNGGQTWQNILVSEDDPFFDRIYFIDENHAWLFARDNVYRTVDGGQNWHIVLKLAPITNV